MVEHISTYTNGFYVKPRSVFTTHDLLDVCELLTKRFNTLFNTTEYRFEPEGISEGGILMANFPGKTGNMYKTIRIWFDTYPWVRDDWRQKPALVLVSPERLTGPRRTNDGDLPTFLKSFHLAPPWTMEELKLVGAALCLYGLEDYKYPPKKDMVHQSYTQMLRENKQREKQKAKASKKKKVREVQSDESDQD